MSDHTDDSSLDEPTVRTNLPGATASGTDAPATASMRPAQVQAGDVFAGRYRLEQQLARRGGTLTWRAFDQKLSRSVLVHILAPHDPRTPAVLDAARQAAVATDSRFLRVLDAVGGDQDDLPSLVVCEYAPGQSLEHLLSSGALGSLEAAWVVRELADALGAMHDMGLFHQRLNPDTVIVTATGNVKIVGFLIEAALHPGAGGEVPWARREAADVRALGKLLYASLVAAWPADPGTHETWGLRTAPTDARGWVAPRTLRPDVSPTLDAICDQILSEAPRHDEMPLTSAKQVARALSRVLGSTDAAADLERRMRFPMSQVRPSTRDAISAGRSAVAGATAAGAGIAGAGASASAGSRPGPNSPGRDADDLDATAQWSAIDDFAASPRSTGARPTNGTGAMPGARGASESRGTEPHGTDPQDADADLADDPAGESDGSGSTSERSGRRGSARRRNRPASDDAGERTAAASHARVSRASEHRQHRLVTALVVLVLASLLIGLVGLLLGRHSPGAVRATPAPSSASASAPTSSSTPGQVLTPVRFTDFDPSADGGNGEESPAQVALAHDGSTATAWKTLTYINDARFGRLKPGVGLVIDLGQVHQIGQVKLTLMGQPTSVQLRVPSDAQASSAPMTSAKQWRTVAQANGAGTSVTLTPTAPVSSRFVLVYLTSLPQIADNQYRGGISEVQVLS